MSGRDVEEAHPFQSAGKGGAAMALSARVQVKVRPRSLVQICLQRVAENFLSDLDPHIF